MRYSFARFLSPAVDIVEHSTVVAIGVEYVMTHWTTPIVMVAIVVYVAVHFVTSKATAKT